MKSEVAADRPSGWKKATEPGIEAVKHSWAPILLIQFAAAILVVVYYRSASLQSALTSLEEIKTRGGIPFDLVTGALAGGVIPQLAKLLTRKTGTDRAFWSDMLFVGMVYAIVAVEIDYFYRLQTGLFGPGHDVATLVKKDLVDMGIFAPLVSIPTAVLLFEWRNAGFGLRGLAARVGNSFYRSKIMPALVLCWAFWVPMLLCIYSLPVNLQFPFSQLIEASWAVLFVFIASEAPAV